MSKKVDERVVEMRFDNKDFESNVKTTMSTLDRLKAALKLPTSSKSLDGVANAAKNSTSNISGLSSAVETVNARFSAMQVVGMTALSNITSAALRAGANFVKSFTIEPITSGFREYELQMNSIQTILANTKSKGTTMSDVTAALDELNEYADLTIYNFAEMTKNIGTFTAAGVDLDTSVGAIKGIANLGAMSSSTSAQVSTAMYQLSQALATGRVSLMDWNSVVNAGMGGEQFQNALKRTAKNFGYDVDGMIKKYGSFRESLTQGGWLTAEVLNETLNQIGGAYDATALKAKGYSDQQIKDILDLADTATKAATEVKTFTQLMDTLKEAAGSGFAKMWQNIFGDFEQAKEFFSGLHETLEPLVTGPIDALNSVIEDAMGGGGSRWSEFEQELKDAGSSVEDFQKKLSDVYKTSTGGSLDKLIEEYGSLEKAIASGKITSEMMTQALGELRVSTEKVTGSTKSLAEWQKVVDDVWRGDYGNIDTGRMERLAAAGWEYAEVQKLVNMTVDGHRLTLEDLSKAQLISLGYTEEQSAALAELAKEASATGSDLNTLINDLIAPKKSGRELFLEGLTNILQAIIKPLQAVGDAFSAVFGMNSDDLYGIIEAFNKFSKTLIMNGDTLDNITRTAKGLFSVLHLVGTFVGKGFTFGFKAVNKVLGFFGTNLLDVTAILGDALFSLDKWLTSGEAMESIFDGIGTAISWIIGPISNFVDSVAGFPVVSSLVTAVGDAFNWLLDQIHAFAVAPWKNNPIEGIKNTLLDAYDALKNLTWVDVLSAASSFGEKFREIFSKLKEKFEELGPDIIEGFQNGLKDGWDKILEFLGDIVEKAVELVKTILGIHSPSTVFFEIGKNIIEGLCNGIKYLSGQVTDTLSVVIEDVKELMSGIDWGAVTAVGVGVGSFVVLYQLTDALQTFATGVKGFSAPFQSAANIMNTTNDFLKKLTDGNSSSKGFKNIADGIKVLAEAIAILVTSIAALTLLDSGKAWEAVRMIGALAAIVGVLAIVLSKFADGGTVLESLQLNSTLLSLGAAFMLLAVSAAIIGSIDAAGLERAKDMLVTFAAVISLLVLVGTLGANIDRVANVLSKIGVAFLLLSVAAKLMGGMDRTSMDAAEEMLLSFAGIVSILILVSTVGGKSVNKATRFLSQIGVAFVLLGVAAKMLGSMDRASMDAAEEMLLAFAGVVSILILVSTVGGKSVGRAFKFLSQIGAAFLMLSIAARLLGGMSKEEIGNASQALLAFVGVATLLIFIGTIAGGGKMAKVGTALLSMSLSIGILAAIAVLLSYVKTENLIKGIAAVTALGLLVSLMAQSARGVRDVKGTFMGIAVAIGVMAASIAVLSLLDPARVLLATACMAVVMRMFALIVKMGSNVQTSMGIMIVMVVALGVMAAAIGILAQMPWQNTLASAAGLSVVLLSLAAACKILSSINSVAPMALVAAGIVTALMAVIAYILVQMNGIDPLGAVANATALSTVLLAFSAVTLILSKIGAGAMAAVQGALAMAVVIAAVTAVLAAIGGINNALEGGLETALDGAISIMEKIGEAIGSFVSGIGVGLSSGLPQIAQNLSLFGVGLTPFITSMKMIDATIVDSATSLAGAILALTASNIIDGIASLFGMSAFDGLGEKFAQLGSALGSFADATAGVDGPTTAIAAQALAAICTAMSRIPNTGGLLEGLFGSQDFSGFAGGMESLGAALKAFDTATTGITPEKIQPAADALKSVIEALSGVPNSGGLLGDLLGGKDYTGFAEGMESIGAALKSFYDATSEISDFEKLNTASNALKTIIEVLSTIPNSGGLLGDLLGGKDYADFADGMTNIGDALKNFNGSVTAIEDFEKLNTATGALKTVIETLSTIPAEGGWLDKIFGSGGINYEDFSNALTGIGESLTNYSGSVTEINIDKIGQSITTLRDVINILRSYSVSSGDIDAGLDNVEKISDLGDVLKTYGEKIANVDPAKVAESATAVSNLKDAINNLVGLDSSGIANFQSAINQLAQTNVQGLIDTFSNIDMSSIGANMMTSLAAGISAGGAVVSIAAALIGTTIVTTLTTAGDKIAPVGLKSMTQFASGVTIGGVLVTTAVIAVSAAAAAAAMSSTGQFRNAGLMMASGLASGIRAGGYGVRQAAYNIASSAAQAARDAVKVASPSKVFREIGGYMGEGMVIGLNDYSIAASKAGSELGESAVDGLTKSISTLGDYLNSDLDVNPTIRPVMDLSDVKNGADQLNGMLNNVDSLGISHATRIDRMMNSRIQNGSFNDVVSAVDRLRGALNNVGNTTYTVNGVTYDDGTNIAVAVGDLTRAIRLERRV